MVTILLSDFKIIEEKIFIFSYSSPMAELDKRLRRIFGCFFMVFIAGMKKGSTFASAFGNDRWLF